MGQINSTIPRTHRTRTDRIDQLNHYQDTSPIESERSNWSGPTPTEVIEVRDLLIELGNLPIEISNEIMNLAEYWTVDQVSCHQPIVVDHGRKLILDIDILNHLRYMNNALLWHLDHLRNEDVSSRSSLGEGVRDDDDDDSLLYQRRWKAKVVKFEWTVISHDQGWSSYPTDHGTYRNSWTWTEANLYTRSDRSSTESSEPCRICTNLHAERRPTVHRTRWSVDHPFLVDLNRRLRSIAHSSIVESSNDLYQLDRSIGLSVAGVAQYDGWENTVESVVCRIFYSFT